MAIVTTIKTTYEKLEKIKNYAGHNPFLKLISFRTNTSRN